MKYKSTTQIQPLIGNISQERALFYDLSLKQITILNWIYKFIESGNMSSFCTFDDQGNRLWWHYISYKHILNSLPILKLNKRNLIRAIEDLEKKGILERLNKKNKIFIKIDFDKICISATEKRSVIWN